MNMGLADPWDWQAWAVVGLAILILAGGLSLLWRRSGGRRAWKWAASAGCLAAAAAVLWFGLGLRWTFNGAGHLRVSRINLQAQARLIAADRAARARTGGPETAEPSASAPWPGFRGPHRDGVAPGADLLRAWPQGGPPRLWRQPIGSGWASFAIAGGRAYTIEQRGDMEVVAAYAVDTGRELWTHGYPGLFEESLGGPGPRATPAVRGGRVFSLGATGILNCLDAATGKRIWTVDILKDNGAKTPYWAVAGSPLVDGDRVIVNPGGPSGRSVVAYAAATGKPIWKSGDDPASYSSPVIVELNGRRQLLMMAVNTLAAYNPVDGTPLWSYPWKTKYDINATQPLVIGPDRVFIASGYDHGCALLQITLEGQRFHPEELWANRNLRTKFSSNIFADGVIYGLDEELLICLDAKTGDRRWRSTRRYGHGQFILAGDRLIVMCENGDLALVEANPMKYHEISRFKALKSKTWNHPALAGGKLLIRNDRAMACYDLSRNEGNARIDDRGSILGFLTDAADRD